MIKWNRKMKLERFDIKRKKIIYKEKKSGNNFFEIQTQKE
jgi:hypothetical protein